VGRDRATVVVVVVVVVVGEVAVSAFADGDCWPFAPPLEVDGEDAELLPDVELDEDDDEFEFDELELPSELALLDEPEDDAGQPSASSATSCARAAVSVVWSLASVCSAEVSCSLAELRLALFCAICEGVPPAFAVASEARSFCSVAFAVESVDWASVALIRPSTCPVFTCRPTVAFSEVSAPLVENVGDDVSAGEMLPDAETLDATVPDDTVTVRATPLEADDAVS
jgi:hypothetical protein